jgi:hypothetical protein
MSLLINLLFLFTLDIRENLQNVGVKNTQFS